MIVQLTKTQQPQINLPTNPLTRQINLFKSEREILNVTKLDRDPSSGTALQALLWAPGEEGGHPLPGVREGDVPVPRGVQHLER